MRIPNPIIDISFKNTFMKFKDRIQCQFISGNKKGFPTPYYIVQVLSKCKDKGEMNLIEYIVYLKVYKMQRILPFWTKKEKDMIIQNISNKFSISLNYESLEVYLNTSFEKLTKDLGYEIEFEVL